MLDVEKTRQRVPLTREELPGQEIKRKGELGQQKKKASGRMQSENQHKVGGKYIVVCREKGGVKVRRANSPFGLWSEGWETEGSPNAIWGCFSLQ